MANQWATDIQPTCTHLLLVIIGGLLQMHLAIFGTVQPTLMMVPATLLMYLLFGLVLMVVKRSLLLILYRIQRDFYYDYPQFCFGGDGFGNYGLIFVVDNMNAVSFDANPFIGFTPITGLGAYGAATTANLTSLLNVNTLGDVTAASDGRIWAAGFAFVNSSYIQQAGLLFKSPGALAENYAGPWDFIIWNAAGIDYGVSAQDSQPNNYGYFNSPQSTIYDEQREALYEVFSWQYPDNSQNARLALIISRDNGQHGRAPLLFQRLILQTEDSNQWRLIQ